MDADLGATWNRDGVIVLAPSNRVPLHRVAAVGGTLEPVTSLDEARRENSHRWPHFLPDGRHFLYTSRSDVKENTGIYVGSLGSKERKWLLAAQSGAAYAPPGYLLFAREQTLMAQRFDPGSLELSGEAFVVAGDVGQVTESASAFFAVSVDGSVLTYQATVTRTSRLTWFDRAGTNLGAAGPEGNYAQPRLAPDGKRVAVVMPDKESGNRDIWLVELSGGGRIRVTSHPANDWWPVWSRDGAQIAFASDRNGPSSIWRRAADGAADEELFLGSSPSASRFPTDWSSDGRFVVFQFSAGRSATDTTDLWALPLFGDRKPFALVETAFAERAGRLSPDGRWLAYVSDESGSSEVYVTPFGAQRKKRISLNGGVQPVWRRDGKELFFVGLDNRVMAVAVRAGEAFEADAPNGLFGACAPNQSFRGWESTYDVSADGRRILINCLSPEASPSSVIVAVHWDAMLKDRVP